MFQEDAEALEVVRSLRTSDYESVFSSLKYQRLDLSPMIGFFVADVGLKQILDGIEYRQRNRRRSCEPAAQIYQFQMQDHLA